MSLELDPRAEVRPRPEGRTSQPGSPAPDRNGQLHDLERRMLEIRRKIDQRLAALVPAEETPPVTLHRSIRHTLLAPGKRLRPVLAVLMAEVLEDAGDRAVDPACAVEMVHAASLILDDLPAMDDARLRRGREANHKVFGDDIAMLASVALLNRAFGVIAESDGLDAKKRVQLIKILSGAIGDGGLVAGQVRDLACAEAGDFALDEIEGVAVQKTAPLFVVGAEMGARVADAPEEWIDPIRAFARNLGLCFQVLDDLADHNGCPTDYGKDVGKDLHRATFVSILGSDRALEAAADFASAASAALDVVGPRAAMLRGLTDTLLRRAGRMASGD